MSLKQKLATINYRNCNVDDIRFTVGKAAQDRSPPINMTYVTSRDEKGNELTVEPFRIRLPRMTYNLMKRLDKRTGQMNYTLAGSLKGCDPFGQSLSSGDDEISALYNFLFNLEQRVKKAAKESNGKWFGKKVDNAILDNSLNRIIHVAQHDVDGVKEPSGKYPPSLMIKVKSYQDKKTGEMKVYYEDLVDNNNKSVDLTYESIPEIFNGRIDASLAITGSIYTINGTSYGVAWNLNMGKIYPQERASAIDIFADDEETTTSTNVNSNTQDYYQEEETVRPTTPVEQPTQPAPPNAPARKKRSAAV